MEAVALLGPLLSRSLPASARAVRGARGEEGRAADAFWDYLPARETDGYVLQQGAEAGVGAE